MDASSIEDVDVEIKEMARVDSYTAKKGDFDSCLLLFSGGLDTSCMVKWIQDKYECDVYTLTMNVGQLCDFGKIRNKAHSLGAKKHFFFDARKEFIEEFCWKAVKANALVGRNGHPVSSSLTRPLIIKKAAEVAKKEGIRVLAHGASGKANDSLRFDNAALTLWHGVKIIAPVREWGMTREAELEYAKSHGIEVEATRDKIYSIDDNMWGRETEAGLLNSTSSIVPDDVYSMVVAPEKAPDKPVFIEIDFDRGAPIRLNGEKLSAVRMVELLNEIGGRNGIGMFDFLEDRGVGVKVRELHESPAAAILIKSHIDVEELVLTKEELRVKRMIELEWVNEALNGFWFTPLMGAMSAFIDDLNKRACGCVRLKLYKGNAVIVSRESPYALDSANLMRKGIIKEINQKATPAFIEINGLQRRASQQMAGAANRNGTKKSRR